jgi:hypothetical protein
MLGPTENRILLLKQNLDEAQVDHARRRKLFRIKNLKVIYFVFHS